MERTHGYRTDLEWTGNLGEGTRSYDGYAREHVVRAHGKPDLLGSSDPFFRGDASRWSPEELLVAALSACHMLWYLHLASRDGICAVGYGDAAEGTMRETPGGSGSFEEVVLRPRVTITRGDVERARALHEEAHRLCYIANSVRFPVRVEATITVRDASMK